jgi:hypothetical protein
MSSFGSKRKARVIKVDDEEPHGGAPAGSIAEDGNSAEGQYQPKAK